MKTTKNVTRKRRAAAYVSLENYEKYEDTGDDTFLNDVHPKKGMKKGTEYYALGEGWEEKRKK